MQDEDTIETVINLFRRNGWRYSYLGNRCFDLFAKSEENSLILKVHENVDSADRQSTEELKRACQYLGASPLIVGERNSRGGLEPEVVYERYGVPTVNLDTLRTYLATRQKPLVFNRRGGYAVPVDEERLEERRKDEGYSLNALAKELGVSRKTVEKYRDGGAASVEKAKRLEEVLGEVVQEADFLEVEVTVTSSQDNRIARQLTQIGFEAAGFSKAPFDAAARDQEERFVGKREKNVKDSILAFLEELQDVAQSRTFLVTEREDDHGRLSSISDRRMKDMDGKEEFKEQLSEG